MIAKQRILVVDDEKLACDSCRDILSEEGFDVETTLSARDGLRRLDSERFDVLLADLRMPDIDGTELIQRAVEKVPNLLVIVITGYPSVDSAVKTLKLGAVEYLPKPFTPDELMSAVKSAIEKKGQLLRPEPEGEVVVKREETERAVKEAQPKSVGDHVITVDIERCMACLTCVVECGMAHVDAEDPDRAPLDEVFRASRVHVEAAGDYAVPVRCRQCEDAPCMKVCPTGAITRKSPKGPVTVDREMCIGCKNCVFACPFGAIYLHEGKNLIVKCDMCADEVAEGRLPVCVRTCPAGALKFERLEDVAARKREQAAQNFLVTFVEGGDAASVKREG